MSTTVRRSLSLPTLVLAISMFATGGCGLVAQYILSTVSTYILGNSIEQFSIIIALTLLAMGIAGVAQHAIGDRGLVEKFVAVEVGIGLLAGFSPLALYAAYAVMNDHFALIQYGLSFVVGFLIGLEIPLAIRINERYAPRLKTNIASIWSLDYVGSFVGALIWAFFLIKLLPLTEISFLVGFVNLGIAALTLAYFGSLKVVERAWPAAIAIVLTAGAMVYGLNQNRGWNAALERRLYDDPIIHAETTKYQRLVLTENRRLNDVRLFLNGNLQFSSTDEMIYHEQLVHPAMAVAPRRDRVLILGGGDGMALREVLKYRDVREVTLVDLDPDMVRLARTHPILRRLNEEAFRDGRVRSVVSPGIVAEAMRRPVRMATASARPGQPPETEEVARVHIFTVDAERFLAVSPPGWDVVIVDLPDPNSVELAKLYSREFYRSLRRAMSADGVAAIQATSPYHAREAFLCIRRTLRAAGMGTLPYHDNVPSFGSWGWMLASPRWDDAEMARLADRVTTFAAPTRYLTPELFQRSRVFGKGWLDAQNQEVSTLMRPVVLDLYLDKAWKTD